MPALRAASRNRSARSLSKNSCVTKNCAPASCFSFKWRMLSSKSRQSMWPSGYAAAPTQKPASRATGIKSLANLKSFGVAPDTASPRRASTFSIPAAFIDASTESMPARSAFMHVRWAIMFKPYSSCAIFATSIVREELPDPPAEYVTETNDGESGARPPITSRASSTGRSPFGGKISNETGGFSPPKTSMMCMRTPLRKTAHRFCFDPPLLPCRLAIHSLWLTANRLVGSTSQAKASPLGA